MTDIVSLNQIFNYDNKTVRVVGTENKPWFCGKDVCDILGYKDIKCTLRDNVKPQYKQPLNMLPYHEGKAVYINEAGVYALVFSSKLPGDTYNEEIRSHKSRFDQLVKDVCFETPVVPSPIVINGAEYRSVKDGLVDKEIIVDWDVMNENDQVKFVRNVIDDYYNNIENAKYIAARNEIEKYIVNKFGAKFKKTAFWPFMKAAVQAKGMVVKYR